MGINPETLRNWVVRAEIDGGQRAGTTSDEAARIAAVERETVSCAATSHLSRLISASSSVAAPWRRPPSISARRTPLRTVSAVPMPSLSATATIAGLSDG